MIRAITIVAFVAITGSGLRAQENVETAKAGDHIVIEMTGKMAEVYSRRTGSLKGERVPDGLQIQTVAEIAQVLKDGRVRIEHFLHVNGDGESVRLVSLTGVIDPSEIVADSIPRGTLIYASPGSEPVATTEAQRTLRLKLSSLKGIKLRTWTLSEQIGE